MTYASLCSFSFLISFVSFSQLVSLWFTSILHEDVWWWGHGAHSIYFPVLIWGQRWKASYSLSFQVSCGSHVLLCIWLFIETIAAPVVNMCSSWSSFIVNVFGSLARSAIRLFMCADLTLLFLNVPDCFNQDLGVVRFTQKITSHEKCNFSGSKLLCQLLRKY